MNTQNLLAKLRSAAGSQRLQLLALVLFVALTTLGALVHFSAKPPITAFEQSRLALSRARQARANLYAPELLQRAERSWEQARLTWRRENEKWFFQRDFVLAQNQALASLRQAQEASQRALTVRDSLEWISAAGIALVKQKVDSLQEEIRSVPVAESLRKRFVAGEILMMESELAFRRDDYLQAAMKAQLAASYVGGAVADMTKTLQTYLRQLPEWQHWAEEAIAWSRQQKAATIIVDKMAHRCQVYLSGRLLGEYVIELGPRWLGHKKQKGDGATPEGRYRVTKKKGLGHSQYYKALEIDYPNETDRQQFYAAQKNGELPRTAHIGGLIEIHGDGGKGVNWTAGCVALNNKDMDSVFELASIGTPVVIVGSLKSLTAPDKQEIDFRRLGLNGAHHVNPPKDKVGTH